jgi:hypothetical protein
LRSKRASSPAKSPKLMSDGSTSPAKSKGPAAVAQLDASKEKSCTGCASRFRRVLSACSHPKLYVLSIVCFFYAKYLISNLSCTNERIRSSFSFNICLFNLLQLAALLLDCSALSPLFIASPSSSSSLYC